jgi:hypothetical protein
MVVRKIKPMELNATNIINNSINEAIKHAERKLKKELVNKTVSAYCLVYDSGHVWKWITIKVADIKVSFYSDKLILISPENTTYWPHPNYPVKISS